MQISAPTGPTTPPAATRRPVAPPYSPAVSSVGNTPRNLRETSARWWQWPSATPAGHHSVTVLGTSGELTSTEDVRPLAGAREEVQLGEDGSQLCLPADERAPIFWRLLVRSTLHGSAWVVERRYSQFDALNSRLRWERVSTPSVLELLPPKRPAPGRDRSELLARGLGLQEWVTALLDTPGALGDPGVVDFFQLDSTLPTDEVVAERALAAAKLQSASRGRLSRSMRSRIGGLSPRASRLPRTPPRPAPSAPPEHMPRTPASTTPPSTGISYAEIAVYEYDSMLPRRGLLATAGTFTVL